MKIGILTYHCVPNFGAQLQAMSTVGYLKRMGHTPVVLHWYPKDLEAQYNRRAPKIQVNCQKQFAEINFPLSRLCRNEKELILEIERNQLDMIITGSDALFKYKPIIERRRSFSKRRLRFINNYVSSETLNGNPFFCDYYGSLSKQIPVVTFSVSSQNCPYFKMNQEEREKMGHYLRNFKVITVRDQWTKNMVEEISGIKEVPITPDPVFAFNQNCYIHIASKEEITKEFGLPDNYALISFTKSEMNPNYAQDIVQRLQEKGITPISLPEPEGLADFGFSHKIELPLTPIKWYALIQHAEAYIGTRMHPIIVSLHNSTPFYSFDGNGTYDAQTGQFNQNSSKIFDILKRAHLEMNTYALKSGLPFTPPREIVEKICSFNKQSCTAFSTKMTESYNAAMNYIFKSI